MFDSYNRSTLINGDCDFKSKIQSLDINLVYREKYLNTFARVSILK